jgi:uncharacterized membrane protein
MNSWLRPKYLLFGFIGLMIVYVLRYDEIFLIDPNNPEWQHITTFKWWLLPHGLAAACALILGPMQFSDRLRKRYTKMHRVMGRVYVAAVFIGAPLGTYIEYLEERMGATRSFTIETMFQAGLWMLTTAIAFAFIRNGKVHQHRQWMTRSFGTGPLIFLEVRVIFGLFGITSPAGVETTVWACTASSLFIADLVIQAQEMMLLRRTRTVRSQSAALEMV